VLAVGLGLGLAPWLSDAASADDPTTLAPQPGDQFAFLTGEKNGQVVKTDDLPRWPPGAGLPCRPEERGCSKWFPTEPRRSDPLGPVFAERANARAGGKWCRRLFRCMHP
jgi:hypothetical protein